jgi:hypothetical protein
MSSSQPQRKNQKALLSFSLKEYYPGYHDVICASFFFFFFNELALTVYEQESDIGFLD